ncbi:Tetratricopeptide repeat-containing protein [Thermomonospora echinospora]|uniref:Tetratricopeptide repeat-containing protein n=2 Tax=Thermomonospora echinospora TaxID=1992 RepID=A0A1H5ZUV9_9ACTN|nr:Tetratricopeptide repeat-containing protein [Thermomonospora echinospora]
MALANTAWIMASAGRKVLVVDWALETDGRPLDRYFTRLFPSDETVLEQAGILDYVQGYRRAGREEPDADPAELWPRHVRWADDVIHVGWGDRHVDFELSGEIGYLGPGRRADRGRSPHATRLDWGAFLRSEHGVYFMARMRAELAESKYDYVLLDSRPGRSDLAWAPTVHLADVLVSCFNINVEDITHSAAATRDLLERTRARSAGGIRVLPVPMMDDDGGEHDALGFAKEFAERRFAGFPQHLQGTERRRYWGSVTVPYKPFYNVRNMLAVFAENPHGQRTILKSYEALAAAITGDRDLRLAPMDEDRRRALRKLFDPPSAAFDVAIVHAPADQPWAEWIGAVLDGYDIRVRPADSAQPAETTIVLLSPRLAESPESPQYLQAQELIIDQESSARGRDTGRLVGIRVREGVLGDVLASIVGLDLVACGDEAQARDRLVAQFVPGGVTVREDADPSAMPRFPRRMPELWNVPLADKDFVGRGELLLRLRRVLRDGGAAGRPAVLHGPAAMGKSHIAMEYALQFGYDYDIVWWIPAGTQHEVRVTLAELLPRLRSLTGADPRASADSYDAVPQVLETLGALQRRWLLVYDNAADPEALAGLMPADGTGHVLVTSQRDDWPSAGAMIEVGRFQRPESIDLLRRRSGVSGVSDQAADRIAGWLADQPLAIDQAAGWMKAHWLKIRPAQGRLATGDVEDRLVDDLLAELGRPVEETGAEQGEAAVRTVTASLARLEEERPGALWLLRICAFLSGEGVSMHLVRSAGMLERLAVHDPAVRDKDVSIDEIVQLLKRYSLARLDQQFDRLHVHQRSLQVIRERMTEEERVRARSAAQLALGAYAPSEQEADDPSHTLRYLELQRHVQPCELLSTANADDSVRRWAVNQVRYLYLTNNWRLAVEIAHQLRVRWSAEFGLDDRLRLRLLVQLANALRELGHHAEAHKWDQEAHRRRRAAQPANQLLNLMIRRSLGADLRARGRFREAVKMDQQTLELFQERLGEEHPQTLSAANNLALSLLLIGAVDEAMRQDRQTYQIRMRVLGDRHVFTWHSVTRLGIHYRELGDHANSRKQLESALGMLRAVAGGAAPATLRAAKELAVTLRHAGERAEALDRIQEALRDTRAFHGPRHPATLACQVSLAASLAAHGRHDEALDDATLNLDLYRELFGEDHPFTRACQANLAIYARLGGRADQALRHGEQAWRTLAEDPDVGPDHPFTLSAELAFANALAAADRFDEAAERERHAHGSFRERLGDGHPHTQIAYTNLQATEESMAGTGAGAQRGARRDVDIDIPST